MPDRFTAVLRTPFAGPWRRFSHPVRVVTADDAGPRPRRARRSRERAGVRALRGRIRHIRGRRRFRTSGERARPERATASRTGCRFSASACSRPETVETLARLPPGGEAELGEWQPSIDHESYLGAISAIKARIEAGDTYQINFTFRLNASFRGDAAALMRDLYAAQAGHWSGFVDIGTHAICSASPELLSSPRTDAWNAIR